MGTPGVEDATTVAEEADEQPLSADLTSLYRAISARANYIAQDRSDIQYAVKELCRRMSAPTAGDMKKLMRLGRYLVGKPRAVALFPWQATRAVQDVFTDANWAGCKASRKSTSGGAILLGSHVVRTWSKTQNTIAQSSAESELLAIVKAATEALGMISLAADLGIDLTARIHIDASAALGILERRGVGRVRHLDVGALWLQEQALRRAVEFMKVKGTSNPADLMTKHSARELVEQHIEALNLECRDGHAATAVKLHSTQELKTQDRRDAKPNTDRLNHNTDNDYDSNTDSNRATFARRASAPGALSDAREALSGATEGAASRGDQGNKGLREPRRRPGWHTDTPGLAHGVFRGARAFRSPCLAGIPWRSVIYRETVDTQSGEVLEAIYPRSHGIGVDAANRRLNSVSDIEVTVHHDYDGSAQAPPKVVRWEDLEPSDDERPGDFVSTAGPVISHADGRPGNAPRVRGRREGLVSTTPSRDASSAEHLGELWDPSDVARVPSPTSLSAVRVPSPALLPAGGSPRASGGVRSLSGRLFCVGRRRPWKDNSKCAGLRVEPQNVSLLERQPSVSETAAERRCKDIDAIQTIMQTTYDHTLMQTTHNQKRYVRHMYKDNSDAHFDIDALNNVSHYSSRCVLPDPFHTPKTESSQCKHKHSACSCVTRSVYLPLLFSPEHCEPLP